jgi:hypothetical protein
MTTHLRPTLTVALLIGFALLAAPTGASSASAPKPVSKSPATFRVVPEVPIPQSTFVIPSQPTEGRNPFFPQSIVRVITPRPPTTGTQIDPGSFVLNGITSPPRPTAMINGRTFEPGEEGEIRMPSGARMLIKCEDIRSESAIISVGGQRRELRLRSGL